MLDLTWSRNKSMDPVIWNVQISRCLFMPITIFPSMTFSSRSIGSTSKYFLKYYTNNAILKPSLRDKRS